MSWRVQLQGIKAFTPDLSAGLGAGYTMTNINYVPSTSSNFSGGGTSYAQISAPVFSLFGKYSF
jgi:hypothetical protein